MNDDIRQIFFAECKGSLELVEQALSMDSMDGETINSVFRAIHSIKGGAGAFGFSDLHRFTHQFENLLDLARAGTLALDSDVRALIIAGADTVADHVRALSDESAAPDDARLIERLEACCQAAEAGSCVPAEVKPTGISAEPGAPAETGDADDFDALFAMLEAPVAEDAPAGGTFAPDDLFDQAAAAIESVGEAANVNDRYLPASAAKGRPSRSACR